METVAGRGQLNLLEWYDDGARASCASIRGGFCRIRHSALMLAGASWHRQEKPTVRSGADNTTSFMFDRSRRSRTGQGRWVAGELAVSVWLALAMFAFLTTRSSFAEEAERALPEIRFVGSHACSQCHARQHQDWSRSHHAGAMQKADANTVLGRFDGSRFVGDGITATFFKKEGKFWISTEGIDGKLTDFEVLYTFGLTPLQQYLVPLSGGRLQAFSIAWDSRSASDGGQRWYDLYPGRRIGPGDPLHWTGIEQNWNYQCAWCHSTDLRKNYDASSKSFDTKWSEINVGCEACHGPASDHIEWSKQSVDDRDKAPGKGFAISFDERRDLSWAVSGKGRVERAKPRTTAKEIGVCAGVMPAGPSSLIMPRARLASSMRSGPRAWRRGYIMLMASS